MSDFKYFNEEWNQLNNKIMTKYRNRYGDIYTFTKQEDGNVLWEGDFEFIIITISISIIYNHPNKFIINVITIIDDAVIAVQYTIL